MTKCASWTSGVSAGVTKERLVEAKEINKSLTALGDVISALSSGKKNFFNILS